MTRPTCPACGGHLTEVREGTVDVLWATTFGGVETRRAPRPFLACDACEFVYDGTKEGQRCETRHATGYSRWPR